MAFRDHPNAHITRLPDATPNQMKHKRQRLGRARRHPVAVKLDSVHNTEAIIWLQVRS